MSTPIRFISVNIEHSKHLHRLEPFLRKQCPDIVCLQEVQEPSLAHLKEIIGTEADSFVPMNRYPDTATGEPVREGLAIFSILPLSDPPAHHYYKWNGEDAPSYKNGPWRGYNRALAWITLEYEGLEYRFGTIHHTWTPDGDVNDEQRRDTDALLAKLEEFPHIVFSGDSNAARTLKDGRPGETFCRFAKRYHDHIPPETTSTIDPELHRSSPLDLVVDVLFSTPDYDIRNVKVVPGISDYCAIVADILRITS